MSTNSKPKNGDAMIPSCLFCGASFVEKEKLGKLITCPLEDGGCGVTFKLHVQSSPLEATPKPKDAPETLNKDE